MSKPPRGAWREVVRIQAGVGPRGGTFWSLTLACGHHKPLTKRKYRMLDSRAGFAPYRVRCLFCMEQVQ